jgi:hypothetical protein
METKCAFTFCQREQGAGTWMQVDVLDVKVPNAQIFDTVYSGKPVGVTATVTVNESNVMLPVCEPHWQALRTVR